MNQSEWLCRICYDPAFHNPFANGLMRLWARCPVEDDADALGCVIMGGEL